VNTRHKLDATPSRTINAEKYIPSYLEILELYSEPIRIDPVVVPEGNLPSIRFAGL
jgi:hypothetical protein